MKLDTFLEKLQNYHKENVFNPWSEFDTSCDIGAKGVEIRQGNLRRYLELRKNAHYLFIAEGLGYQGGHFSGIAITSERILLGEHPSIRPESVLGEWQYVRTSDPQSGLLNRTQKLQGFNEPTDTVVWNTLATLGLDTFDVILWNIFPFHPHQPGKLLSNRTPSQEELDVGIEYARQLLELFPGMKIIAIGAKAAATLEHYGVPCQAVRHPSMGGASEFKEQVKQIFVK